MSVPIPVWISKLSHPRQRPYRAAIGLCWAAALRGLDLMHLRCRDFEVWDDPNPHGGRDFALWLPCSHWDHQRIPLVVPREIGWWVLEEFDPRDRPDADPLFPSDKVRSEGLQRALRRAGYDGLGDLRRDRVWAQGMAHGAVSAALLARVHPDTLTRLSRPRLP